MEQMQQYAWFLGHIHTYMYEYVNISQTWPVTSAPGSVFMRIFILFVLFGTELVNVKKLR